MAFRFQLNEPGVTLRGAETGRKSPWQSTRVEVVFASGQTQFIRPDESGLVYASSAFFEPGATAACVTTQGPHHRPLRWRMDRGRGVVIPDGETARIDLSTRIRLSLWAFNLPFMNARGEPDAELLNLAAKAHIDDVTVVYGILWNERRVPHGVRWMSGSPAESQWKRVALALNKRGIQFHLGYTIGDFGTYTKTFSNWLDSASDQQIQDHAKSIVEFVDRSSIPIDGLSFDLELNPLGRKPNHERNLALLYRTVSGMMAERDGVVSYATGPFTHRDQAQMPHTRVQPYSLVRDTPNLIARPMCYDGKDAFPHAMVSKSVDFALRRRADNDGEGIHPGQLQMGLWTTEAGKEVSMEKYCRELLAPNRVGLIVYRLATDPKKKSAAKELLQQCREFNAWLNPGKTGIDIPAQPLQVPNP